jgi:hypothetical protein
MLFLSALSSALLVLTPLALLPVALLGIGPATCLRFSLAFLVLHLMRYVVGRTAVC